MHNTGSSPHALNTLYIAHLAHTYITLLHRALIIVVLRYDFTPNVPTQARDCRILCHTLLREVVMLYTLGYYKSCITLGCPHDFLWLIL